MTFHRPTPRVKQVDYTPKPRVFVLRKDAPPALVVPIPKSHPWSCEAYRRVVASMDCIHCGKGGPSQAAHADQGKGMGIKSDDRTCFPLCADSPGRRGCHSLIGASGLFTQEQRRALEQNHGRKTRERIKAEGKWRDEWPEFEEDQKACQQ